MMGRTRLEVGAVGIPVGKAMVATVPSGVWVVDDGSRNTKRPHDSSCNEILRWIESG